jgi:hypothetical protein
MDILEQLKKELADFPSGSKNPEDLARLQEFLERMKKAGIARTREYDLPPPDTLGRNLVSG